MKLDNQLKNKEQKTEYELLPYLGSFIVVGISYYLFIFSIPSKNYFFILPSILNIVLYALILLKKEKGFQIIIYFEIIFFSIYGILNYSIFYVIFIVLILSFLIRSMISKKINYKQSISGNLIFILVLILLFSYSEIIEPGSSKIVIYLEKALFYLLFVILFLVNIVFGIYKIKNKNDLDREDK